VADIDGGAVIAEGTPDQLKASVGGEHLQIVLAAGADIEAVVVAVKPYATGKHGLGRRRAAGLLLHDRDRPPKAAIGQLADILPGVAHAQCEVSRDLSRLVAGSAATVRILRISQNGHPE